MPLCAEAFLELVPVCVSEGPLYPCFLSFFVGGGSEVYFRISVFLFLYVFMYVCLYVCDCHCLFLAL